MAGAFEQTIIIGNVGRADDLRYTQSGKAVFSFSVAVSSSWTDKQTNEKRESTNWYKVTAWEKHAESLVKYVKKGMSVMVSGSVQASAYLDAEGKPQASLELTARDIQFLTRVDDSPRVPVTEREPDEEIPF